MKDETYLMHTLGWILFEDVIPNSLISRLHKDLEVQYNERRKIQINNGIGDEMSGTCHHLLGDHNSMDELVLSLPLHDEIKNYFNGPYILNSIGAFINNPFDTAYVSKIHRDVRTFSKNFPLLVNMLVMLDDFTIENGATYIFSGSHQLDQRPSEEIFYKYSTRAVGKAGDILLFDSNLWHAAGLNQSQAPRRGLTLTYSRPFFKPQIDYPRLLGIDYARDLSETARQVLGYDALIPSTLNEFYQPRERRFYKSHQG